MLNFELGRYPYHLSELKHVKLEVTTFTMEILYTNHCGDIGNTVKTVSLVTKNIKISC